MTPERWRQVTDVFYAALAHEAPTRASYLHPVDQVFALI
jgi:hypothetical protein